MLHHPYSFEVRQVCSRRSSGELRHPDCRLAEIADAGETAITIVNSKEHCRGSNRGPGVRHLSAHVQRDRQILRLQLTDQICQLGVNDSPKLIATSRRVRQYVGTERTESLATALQRARSTAHVRRAEPHCLRTEIMRPDRDDAGVTRISVAPSRLVGHEYPAPLRIHQSRGKARIVECRRPSRQPRIVRQWKRLRRSPPCAHRMPVPRSGCQRGRRYRSLTSVDVPGPHTAQPT